MKKILLTTASALLIIGQAAGTTAAAATPPAQQPASGAQPFLVGPKNIDVAADMVEASLAKKKDGTALVSDDLCVKRQSCITPKELYDQIRAKHPDVGLANLQDLPRYMRSLARVDNPPSGKRYVGRIITAGGTRTADYGMQREPFPDEVTWNDPNTGEEVFMGHCLNVIDLNLVSEAVVVAKTECVIARIPVNQRTINARIAGFGLERIPRKDAEACFGYKLPGATEFVRGWPNECRYGTWEEELPDREGRLLVTTCVLGPIIAHVGKQLAVVEGGSTLQGGVSLNGQTGFLEVRLPAQFAFEGSNLGFFVCLEEHMVSPDGRSLAKFHAQGMLTTPDDFQRPPGWDDLDRPAGAENFKRVTFPQPVFDKRMIGQTVAATR